MPNKLEILLFTMKNGTFKDYSLVKQAAKDIVDSDEGIEQIRSIENIDIMGYLVSLGLRKDRQQAMLERMRELS